MGPPGRSVRQGLEEGCVRVRLVRVRQALVLGLGRRERLPGTRALLAWMPHGPGGFDAPQAGSRDGGADDGPRARCGGSSAGRSGMGGGGWARPHRRGRCLLRLLGSG
jgi:hypothetical protein